MFSKSLVLFTVVGVMAGLLYGVFLLEIKNTNQLVFSEGPSLSIVTEKSDFKKGEDIRIRIVNSGTVPLIFSDTSYGLKITGLSGMLMYSPPSSQEILNLEPRDEIEFVWDQTKNDGDPALEGLYKIHSTGMYGEEDTIKKSITVNIWK